MYYVYILRSLCKSTEYYIGYTAKAPAKRLLDHNAGFSTHTNRFKPWRLVWYCAFKDEKKAKKFEYYLKSGSGTAFRNKRLV